MILMFCQVLPPFPIPQPWHQLTVTDSTFSFNLLLDSLQKTSQIQTTTKVGIGGKKIYLVKSRSFPVTGFMKNVKIPL